MKLAFVLIAAFTSGCASSYLVDSSMIGVIVQPPPQPCSSIDQDIPVVIQLRNRSRGLLKIGVEGKKGPPYQISWLYYDILNERGEVDWKHGPGGHGPMPPSTLSIGPGDSTSVYADLYGVGVADQSNSFQIRFEDLDKHIYITDPFRPCALQERSQAHRSAPNNSFKPSPLRGLSQNPPLSGGPA